MNDYFFNQDMEDIFSTRERIRILKEAIFKIGNMSVNDVAHRLYLSKGLVSKYFGILVKEGILRKINSKFLVTEIPSVKGIRILLNFENIPHRIFKKYPVINSVGLYGSCARGENTEESDVDLWIKIGVSEEENLAALTSELNKKIRNAKILFLTDEKLRKLKEENELFYHSLAFSSIVIYGDKNAIQI